MKNPLSEAVYQRRSKPREEDIRGPYFRDQTAIIHSLPFRRLKHKTQVFFAPENDHVCTRIEHVLHVATIAETICKGLNRSGWELVEDLAFAIGLGHDLGHAPFGHSGERELERLNKGSFPFRHEINSYRVAEHLANSGEGLNLTWAVKDGILCHNGESFEKTLTPSPQEKDLEKIVDRSSVPSTYEGCIVRFSDKIAYLGRDIEDAIAGELISLDDVPERIRREIGTTNGEIINTLVIDLIHHSRDSGQIGFSEEKYDLFRMLSDFNYDNIYRHRILSRYEKYCERIIRTLYEYLMELVERIGEDYERYATDPETKLDRKFGHYLERMDSFYRSEGADAARKVTDYIAGMTDGYALEAVRQITLPEPIEFP